MEIGQILENKYEILSVIGMGGASIVYLGYNKKIGKMLAVKEYKKDLHKQVRDFIQSEIDFLKVLDHPYIPKIFDIVEVEQNYIIVMEYIEGETLDKKLQQEGAFPEKLVINIAGQLTNVFQYIHEKNIVYRDLKPSNVLLKPNGFISLVDFGIARYNKPNLKFDTTVLGTRGFAPPEQYSGQTDCRTDIYAFGVTLFNLLTGESPLFIEKFLPIRYYNPKISYMLEFIIDKCIKTNPNDRFQSMNELKPYFEDFEKMEKIYRKKHFIKVFLDAKRDKKMRDKFMIEKSKEKEPGLIRQGHVYNVHPPIIDVETTGLLINTNDEKVFIPSSVLNKQTINIFLSYCHSDEDLADIICSKLAQYSFIKISRYSTDVPYKKSFRDFMNTLGEHDKVVMIVSDKYLKSRACMYEVGQLINSSNFQKKILFIIISNSDKEFYKESILQDIEAKIYDPHERNQYIIYWENQCKVLKDDLERIEDECSKIETLEVIRDIKKIISSDIGLFMKYLSDVRGLSFKEMYQNNFSEILDELGIN